MVWTQLKFDTVASCENIMASLPQFFIWRDYAMVEQKPGGIMFRRNLNIYLSIFVLCALTTLSCTSYIDVPPTPTAEATSTPEPTLTDVPGKVTLLITGKGLQAGEIEWFVDGEIPIIVSPFTEPFTEKVKVISATGTGEATYFFDTGVCSGSGGGFHVEYTVSGKFNYLDCSLEITVKEVWTGGVGYGECAGFASSAAASEDDYAELLHDPLKWQYILPGQDPGAIESHSVLAEHINMSYMWTLTNINIPPCRGQ